MGLRAQSPKTFVVPSLLICALAAVGHAASKASPSISIQLRPDKANALNHIPYLEISVLIDGPNVAAGQPFMAMPLVTSNPPDR
jgi:hypothetical protein